MSITRRLFLRPLAAVAVLAFLAAGHHAPAQEDDDDDEAEAQVEVMAAPARQVMFRAAEQNFDNGVFGTFRTAAAALDHLDQHLTLQTEEIDRTCGLTEAQKKKIWLAGRGDVKRVFDRIDEKRRTFRLIQTDQQGFQALHQELLQIHATLQGLFGDGSIFSKTLKTTLDAGQSARYEQVVRERRSYAYQVRVEMVIAQLDRDAGLDSGQRRRLLKLIEDETRPPKKSSEYDQQVVLFQIARLPADKLKSVFNDNQLLLLGPAFNNARGFESYLAKHDYLPDAKRP